jgi:hypothetical protein
MKMNGMETKVELIAALEESSRRAGAWFQDLPASQFFTRHGDTWSPSDNLDHLIKAVKPVTRALKLPKITLLAMFGKAEKISMTYEELCRLYRDAIARGGQASGRFLPEQQSPLEDAEAQKMELLRQWTKVSAELVSAAEKWNEDELDQYRLPHPLIGKLTVREMLFFTVYHSLRHASLEGD